MSWERSFSKLLKQEMKTPRVLDFKWLRNILLLWYSCLVWALEVWTKAASLLSFKRT